MDREQIIDDLKNWLGDKIEFGDEVSPYEVLEKIEELEELYE